MLILLEGQPALKNKLTSMSTDATSGPLLAKATLY